MSNVLDPEDEMRFFETSEILAQRYSFSKIIFVSDKRVAHVKSGIQITRALGIHVVKTENVVYVGYASCRTEDVLCRKLYCVENS